MAKHQASCLHLFCQQPEFIMSLDKQQYSLDHLDTIFVHRHQEFFFRQKYQLYSMISILYICRLNNQIDEQNNQSSSSYMSQIYLASTKAWFIIFKLCLETLLSSFYELPIHHKNGVSIFLSRAYCLLLLVLLALLHSTDYFID